MWYFAYGSNCSEYVMQRKGVRYSSRQRASLHGFELVFNKMSLKLNVPSTSGYANIQESPEGIVEGVLYRIVPGDLSVLDSSERHPEHYKRISIRVETKNRLVECETYRAQADKVKHGLKPPRDYLDHLLAARNFFSPGYLQFLQETEVDE